MRRSMTPFWFQEPDSAVISTVTWADWSGNWLSRMPDSSLYLTDAVFSMDGDIVPVVSLLELCENYNAWLMLDDAHGFGVLGPTRTGNPGTSEAIR